MGSPKEEEGRYDDEGPRHEVHISRGYWLFDTPCTQALWRAVTIIRVGFRARIVRWRM
jgi:formylglycine-generating enzyme required for sulfatase activity